MAEEMENLKRKVKIVKLGDLDVKIRPKVKDVELFLTMKRDRMTEEDAAKISKVMINIVKRGNPTWSEDDVEDVIVEHYGELLVELSIQFGFAKREDFEDQKKKL